MKLISARIKNFRLLRDLELDFSSESEKRLTVFRAPNETGKTTIVRALRWGLYGDNALPNKGVKWRMHPIDWDKSDSVNVHISVTIEFEILKINQIGDQRIETHQRFRISRSVMEVLDADSDTWRKTDASVKLFEVSEGGVTPIDPPEAIIREELPTELRDVFFTDGDRAMDFIEADINVRSKRNRVEKAIRALLGIGVLQNSIAHVTISAKEANRRARSVGGDVDLTRVIQNIENNENDISVKEAKKTELTEELTNIEEMAKDTTKQIDLALKDGNKQQLIDDKNRLLNQKEKFSKDLSGLQKKHSQIFEDVELAKYLLAPALDKSNEIMNKLEMEGQIPHTTIPVLNNRLKLGECICGESLSPDDNTAKDRIDHINHLIEANKSADDLQRVMTALFYKGQDLTSTKSTWKHLRKNTIADRETLALKIEQIQKDIRAHEAKIDALPDTDIQKLREFERDYQRRITGINFDISEINSQLRNLRIDVAELIEKRDRLLKNKEKGLMIRSELAVISDVAKILENSYHTMTTTELRKVSDMMSEIFLKMVGADPKQKSVIHSAMITEEFDIIVKGPSGRHLDPDHDLNGASRRALTLAFILALTNVSEVEAPNIIDTPLGMMDGFVKLSVLKTAVEYSQQIILFLTHSEIAGCEEVIRQKSGIIKTLTNTAHFPTMLVNDPGSHERKVILCDCDHESVCQICERRKEQKQEEVA